MNNPKLNIDESKLNAFMNKALADMGAAMNTSLILIGDRLGLYKAMAGVGAMTSGELARKTGTAERYVREWLSAQAAGGYIIFDAELGKFTLPDEQALALAVENSPAFLPGAYQIIASTVLDEPKVRSAFLSGEGVSWHEHNCNLFEGTERFFRPSYSAHLVNDWIPALDGVEDKLKRGATVADVGCGFGASTILMAQAYPQSRFFGFDYHLPSIEWARAAAETAGVSERLTFEVASSKEFPGNDYDLVAFFDCLHDMGDPIGASAHVRETLKRDGTWMIVEPYANDKLQDNLNLIGRIYYAASTLICTPASLGQEVGLGLGAQAGEARLKDVVTQGGFTHFRRATETPFNLILEVRL